MAKNRKVELPAEVVGHIFGGLVGALVPLCGVDVLRAALRELANNDAAWQQFELIRAGIDRAVAGQKQ